MTVDVGFLAVAIVDCLRGSVWALHLIYATEQDPREAGAGPWRAATGTLAYAYVASSTSESRPN
jgi:hypothetical protein